MLSLVSQRQYPMSFHWFELVYCYCFEALGTGWSRWSHKYFLVFWIKLYHTVYDICMILNFMVLYSGFCFWEVEILSVTNLIQIQINTWFHPICNTNILTLVLELLVLSYIVSYTWIGNVHRSCFEFLFISLLKYYVHTFILWNTLKLKRLCRI